MELSCGFGVEVFCDVCECLVQGAVVLIVEAYVSVDAWYVVGDPVVVEPFAFAFGSLEEHSVLWLHEATALTSLVKVVNCFLSVSVVASSVVVGFWSVFPPRLV